MDKTKLNEARQWIREELDRCQRFWLDNGMDEVNGGVYTCLDREGKLYSTDKSVWMQGRCGWIFAWLCHLYGVREEWLAASKSCLDFMEKCCLNREAGDRMYFTVTADGKPLRQRRYYFSEAFYAMANAEYYGVTGDDIRSAKRNSNISNARQIAIYAVREITGMSMKLIGEEFGGRDHSTIVYAINQIEKNMSKDPKLKSTVEDIIKNIRDR